MATQLTDIWEIVDRSIFEKIRLLLVEHGYLPDITQYPDTDTGVQGYNNRMAQIVADKGFAIELFGAASSQKRYSKKCPRIVYTPRRIFAGDLGGGPDVIYESKGQTYDGKTRPPQTSELQFDISLVSNEIRQERVMNSIIGLALSKRAYVPFYTNVTTGDTEEFFVTQMSYRDVPDTKYGIIEKIYTYKALDLWDREFTEVGGVAPLLEATVCGFVNNKNIGELIVLPGDVIRLGQSAGTPIITLDLISIQGSWSIDWGDGTFSAYNGTQSNITHVWTDSTKPHAFKIIDFVPENVLILRIRSENLLHLELPVGLVNLTEINLKNNNLGDILLPDDLISLVELDLSFSQITSITTSANWISLEYINLYANFLLSFETHIEWSKLWFVDLGQNQLTDFIIYKEWAWQYEDEIFPGFIELEPGELYLEDNSIGRIQSINNIVDQLSQTGIEDLTIIIEGDNMAGVSPRTTAPNGVAAIENLEDNLFAFIDYNTDPYIMEIRAAPLNLVDPTSDFRIRAIQYMDGPITIDWGDGDIEDIYPDSYGRLIDIYHTYADRDAYHTIKMYNFAWEFVQRFQIADFISPFTNIIFPKNLEDMRSMIIKAEGFLETITFPDNAYNLETLSLSGVHTNLHTINWVGNQPDLEFFEVIEATALVDQITIEPSAPLNPATFRGLSLSRASLSVEAVNYILGRLEELTRGVDFTSTNKQINLSGGTSASPDSTSGSYDGIYSRAELQARGFTVTTN